MSTHTPGDRYLAWLNVADQAIPLAAGIFLDVLNVVLFFLQIFGRLELTALRGLAPG